MERQEARNLGYLTYNTGKPCKHGHFADRYTKNGGCRVCIRGNLDKQKAIESYGVQEAKQGCASIYLLAMREYYPAIKMMLDGFVNEVFPGVNPHSINPLPFNEKSSDGCTYRILVKVPISKTQEAYDLSNMFIQSTSDALIKINAQRARVLKEHLEEANKTVARVIDMGIQK